MGGCINIRGREGSAICPSWCGVPVCSHAISAALPWLPSWRYASSSRSSPTPAPVHPGMTSDALRHLCVLGYQVLGSLSQEHVLSGACPWLSKGDKNLHLKGDCQLFLWKKNLIT